MCWSAEASLYSAIGAWCVCAFLYFRNKNHDRWASMYLLTFTFTQVVDFALWKEEGKIEVSVLHLSLCL